MDALTFSIKRLADKEDAAPCCAVAFRVARSNRPRRKKQQLRLPVDFKNDVALLHDRQGLGLR